MKKKFLSLVLLLAVLISSLGNTFAFAEVVPTETPPADDPTTKSQITLSDEFNALSELSLKSIHYSCEVDVNNPDITLTATSSAPEIIDIREDTSLKAPGEYYYDLAACKNGTATLTFTASDGVSVTKTLTVEGTGEMPYTVSSDVNEDFTLAKGSSKLININFVNNDIDVLTFPLLGPIADGVVQTTLIEADQENGNYLYRVDVIGDKGQTVDLFLGGYGFIPSKLCTVTIGENKNLNLDTDVDYICNTGDTYRFVAYTNSTTTPKVSTNNDVASVTFLRKVTGGYEYKMTALKAGISLVKAELNGETSSFPVSVNAEDDFPILSMEDDEENVTLPKGNSRIYKFSAMGGGDPIIVGSKENVISSKLVKKEGTNYSFEVTAVGQPSASTEVYAMFPESRYDEYAYELGTITVAKPELKSDTTQNFTLKKGSSYVFKITNAATFYAGSSNVFKTELIKKSGADSFYRITAIGNPGQAAGFYMAAAGGQAKKVCVVTIGSEAAPKSDTNSNFSVKIGESYMFKISNATGFFAGTPGIFKTELAYKSGSDSYYRITPTGKAGQQAGFYMTSAGYPTQKVCVVTVEKPTPINIESDTNSDFSVAKNATYQFKITAPGASAINFCAGTDGVFKITFVRRTGSDFYYKITAVGKSGQSTGIYASVPGQSAKKVCVVSVK
jgi:hypothetical protein